MAQIKKVFISQPMADKTNEQIIGERTAALADIVVRTNFAVEQSNLFFEDAQHDAKPLWFLGESIKMMAEADIVYFCKGWQNQRGCMIEHECATRYGKTCMYAKP